jgi:hypothetical protein
MDEAFLVLKQARRWKEAEVAGGGGGVDATFKRTCDATHARTPCTHAHASPPPRPTCLPARPACLVTSCHRHRLSVGSWASASRPGLGGGGGQRPERGVIANLEGASAAGSRAPVVWLLLLLLLLLPWLVLIATPASRPRPGESKTASC